jgi:hypothetical protein
MGVYNNNKDGTRSTIANTIQVVDAPMEQFVSRGEFNAVTPNDVSADNKLVAENEVTKAVSTIPTASSSLVGTIVQYVGTTTVDYTNGFFYKCTSDGQTPTTYSWITYTPNIVRNNDSIIMNDISNNIASGSKAVAQGNRTTASGWNSHAEGSISKATGVNSHAEGDRTEATNNDSHAEGYITKATGRYSHSQNEGTIAKGLSQTAIGAYNIEQGNLTSKVDTDYAFIIGNGTDSNNRSNALAVKWNGTIVFNDGSELQSNYYVTPEMFGAVGDGVTNDLAAFQAALLQSRPIYLESKHYLIDGDLYITQPNTVIQGKCGAYSSTSPCLIFTNQHGIHIEQATYKMLFKGFAIFSDGTGLTMQGDGRIANLTFEDIYFKCRRDVFLDAETGYIYFIKCHFDFDPNTTFDGDLVKITYTGSSANRANYISFNQCEFEGQNIPNNLTDANCYLIYLDNCSNINITASDICNCYNAIKFGTTGTSQFITLTNNYLWNIKTIANLASCLYFNMTGNSQYTSSGVQPLVFPSNKRGHVITGNIFDIGAWSAVSIENLYTVFDNNQILGTISNEVLTKLHIGEYKGYVVPTPQ